MLFFIRLFRQHRLVLLFLLLELLAVVIRYRERNYISGQGSGFMHDLRAQMYLARFKLQRYLFLDQAHQQLLEENLELRRSLQLLNRRLDEPFVLNFMDKDRLEDEQLISAKIIHNGYTHLHNFITIDKGSRDGIVPGMGLLAPGGVAGRVRYVSEHFATAYSLLDTDVLTSALLGKKGVLCSVRWVAQGPQHARLEYLPRHAQPEVGDTVYTSGYDGIYPSLCPVGVISELSIEAHNSFYQVDLRLLADFSALHYVYLYRSYKRAERDSLQKKMAMP